MITSNKNGLTIIQTIGGIFALALIVLFSLAVSYGIKFFWGKLF